MRKVNLIVLALVAIIYLLVAPVAWAQGGNVEQEIKALLDQTIQANLKADASFFQKHYADDATIVHGDGKMYTKAQEIEDLKSGVLKYESDDVRDSKIRVYGNMAVVNALVSYKGLVHGKPYGGDVRRIWVWMKQKGSWKCVAYQVTRVAPASQ